MPNNVYNFRQSKLADPKRLTMIADAKPKPNGSRYFAGLVILCALIGFVGVQAWPKLSTAVNEPVSVSASISVRIIDGDTISLGDGQPNVRLVGFNARNRRPGVMRRRAP